jgi:hypothetical protein
MKGPVHGQDRSAAPHTLSRKKDTMRDMQFRSVGWARPTPRTMRRLDTYAFVGVIVAIACFLWWFFTTVT